MALREYEIELDRASRMSRTPNLISTLKDRKSSIINKPACLKGEERRIFAMHCITRTGNGE